MKDKTSVFYHIFSLLARSQTCFDTIVRVMLIMLRKNTRNNILIREVEQPNVYLYLYGYPSKHVVSMRLTSSVNVLM